MSELEKLEEQSIEIQERIWEIRNAETEKKNQKYIGKCFRYRNAYSSDETWWLYKKVIGTKNGGLDVIQFQIDVYGYADVKRYHLVSIDSSDEITEMDFSLAWHEFKNKIEQFETDLDLP